MPTESLCLCAALRRASRAATAAYDSALAPSGLRVTQFSVLRILARIGPVPVTRLAAEAALERSTMGRNLEPLARAGLVRLTPDPQDRRARNAHITPAGEAAIAAAMPGWQAAQRHVARLIPPAAIRALADRLVALSTP
jgi:DNA-binding MarR family transcriptional regulator